MARRSKKPKDIPPIPFFEGPGRRHPVNSLKWLLSFTNTDIPSLPTARFLKLMNECLRFFYEKQYPADPEFKHVCLDTTLNRTALNKIQGVTKEYLDHIRDTDEQSIQLGDPKYVSEHMDIRYSVVVQEHRISFRRENPLRDYGPVTFAELMGIASEPPSTPGLTVDEEYIDKVFVENPQVNEEDYVFFSTFVDPNVWRSLIPTLVALLQSFPLDRIKKCPMCDRYFLITRKKENPLCARCLRRMATYKWREEHPDEYRARQRKTMKKQYRKKTADALGKPVDKINFQKRSKSKEEADS